MQEEKRRGIILEECSRAEAVAIYAVIATWSVTFSLGFVYPDPKQHIEFIASVVVAGMALVALWAVGRKH